MTRSYVDASALVKVVLDEAESPAMRRWYVESDEVVTSIVGVIETRRAVRRSTFDAGHLESVLRSVVTVGLGQTTVRSASLVAPARLRTLDAIHLATAIALAGDLDAFVTYDDRLAEAARSVGLPVVRPA
ncbi:type II toxin-antitoxin system VapC family toxin [soil metagenome]